MHKKNPQHIGALIEHILDILKDNEPYPPNHLPQYLIDENPAQRIVRIKMVSKLISRIKTPVLAAYHNLLTTVFERKLVREVLYCIWEKDYYLENVKKKACFKRAEMVRSIIERETQETG